jgi:hypothetical protein
MIGVKEEIRMKWKCDCGFDRNLHSDGIVEVCLACGSPEHDALREAIEIPGEPEFINEGELDYV